MNSFFRFRARLIVMIAALFSIFGLLAISSPVLAATQNFSGSLSSSDPKYNRTGSSCPTDFYYDNYSFTVGTTGLYTMETLSASLSPGTSDDTYLYLYSPSFNPASPTTNLISSDDDSGAGFLSQLIRTLNTGTTYILVVTSFNTNATGPYTGRITGPGTITMSGSGAFGTRPCFTSAAPASGTQGTAYSHTFTASGSPAPTFSVTGGSLPPGLSLSSGGVLSGTPTAGGPYSFTVTATNGAGSATQNVSMTINSSGVAPSFTSGVPANGLVGTPYSHTFTASGSPAPTFSLFSGSLPPGLTLSGATLSGTPTTSGNYTFTIRASNSAGTANQNVTMAINQVPAFTSAAPANGLVGSAYSHTFTASGFPAPTFALFSGSLPPGLTLSGATLSGTPTTSGNYTFTIRASNSAGTADQNVTMAINQVPAFTSGAPASGLVGTAYSHTFTASGFPAPTFALFSGSLPPGLSLTGGVLSGTPTTSGNYTFTIRASNSAGTADQNVTMAINQVPAFTSAAPANGTVGIVYSHTFSASGFPAPTFALFSGTLPPGLSLSGATLSGTPTAGGSYTFTIRATNSAGTADQNVTMTVNQAPSFTSGSPASGTVGTAYSHTFAASGVPSPTFSLSSGTLPPGLSLAGGVLSGTPTAGGVYNFSITASNGIVPDATQNVSLTVNEAPAFTSGAPANGLVGTAYSHTFTASGYPALSFSVSSGTLPPGLSLNTSGLLDGIPTTAGSYSFTVTATNAVGSANQNVTLVVDEAPGFTSGAPANGVVSAAYSHTFTASGSPAPSFSVSSGTLPPGLNLNASGLLDGIPTTAGSYSFTVTATNAVGAANQNVTLVVDEAPGFTSGAPANGVMGTAYSHTFTASGSPAPSFSVSSGSLPPGLSLNASGLLDGTPTTVGSYSFTVTTANGIGTNATQNITLVIDQVAGFNSQQPSPPDGTVGVPYTFTFVATGSPAPTFNLSGGTLPPELSLNSVTGVLSGLPTLAGTYNFPITVSNGVGSPVVWNVTITIYEQLAAPPPAPACTDVNLDEPGMLRTHFTNDADRAGLNCRLLAASGHYMTWLGGPITFAENVGNQTVLDLGVVAAADVFKPGEQSGFSGDVVVCLKGSGYMIYLNALGQPRVPQLWSTWTTDAFPGYTCTTLYAPGTVVLVSKKP